MKSIHSQNSALAIIFMISLFSCGVLGCKSAAKSPVSATIPNAEAQAYANANKEILTGFGTKLKQLSARPIPKPPKTATKWERREVLAKEMDAITVTAQDAITRLDSLTPPPSMREIHVATRDVLVRYRDGYANYVAAIRRGSRKEVNLVSDKMETDTRTAFVRLRTVLKMALIREGKTPEEAESLTANVVL